jgi:hypothetical protein
MTEYNNSTVLNFNDDEDDDILEIEEEILNDSDNYKKNIFDMNLSLELRIKIISKYYKIYPDEFFEIVSRITGMYSFSGTKTLEKFIYSLSTETELSSFLKIESSTSLLSFSEFEEEIFEKDDESLKEIKRKSNDEIKFRNEERSKLAYKSLNIVCESLDENLPTPYKVETICKLMKNEIYKEQALLYFFKIINDKELDCEYRYKTILSLEKRDIVLNNFYIFESCVEFLTKSFNFTIHRILAAQNLLQNGDFKDKDDLRNFVENTLLSFAKDENLDYNLRADAADTLLNLGCDEMKKEGREIIYFLGQVYGGNKTIFDNAQNVHVEEIEKSVLEIIVKLSNYPTLKANDNPIDYEYTQTKIKEVIDDILTKCENIRCKNCDKFDEKSISFFCNQNCESTYNKKNKIQISFNRISMDKALYFNNTISNILVKVWSYIQNNKYKIEMEDRLISELDDMSGTCSSGFASRIVNSITGFGEFELHISFEDQIVSNFTGRLNACARKIMDKDFSFYNEMFEDVLKLYIINNKIFSEMKLTMDERKKKYLLYKNIQDVKDECVSEFCENVINEMTLSSSKFANRQHFLLFFKTCMPKIYKEMFEEFKDYITDSEFDLSFRRAISIYEGDM